MDKKKFFLNIDDEIIKDEMLFNQFILDNFDNIVENALTIFNEELKITEYSLNAFGNLYEDIGRIVKKCSEEGKPIKVAIKKADDFMLKKLIEKRNELIVKKDINTEANDIMTNSYKEIDDSTKLEMDCLKEYIQSLEKVIEVAKKYKNVKNFKKEQNNKMKKQFGID